MFTQPFVQSHTKENTKTTRHWPFYGNAQVTGEFPAKKVINGENVSI